MELNEVIRRVLLGRRLIILTCLVVAVGAMLAFSISKTPTYVSSARMQASSSPPGSDTEADSILNRVTGIATSSREVDHAMQVAGIHGIPAAHFADGGIIVSRLGSSAVFDLSVTDPDPRAARALTNALTNDVVDFLNTSGNHQVNSLMSQLESRREQLVSQRQHQAGQLARATKAIDKANLTAEVGTLDQEIGDLDSSLRELAVNTATATSAAVISSAGAAEPVRGHLVTDLALAVIIGLVGGVLISLLLEMVRPRLAGGRAFARELGIPMLGTVCDGRGQRHGQSGGDTDPSHAVGPSTLLAIRAAATRSGVRTVVLVGSGSDARIHGLAARLDGQLGPQQTFSSPTGEQAASNGHGNRGPVLATGAPAPAAGSLGIRVQQRPHPDWDARPQLSVVSLTADDLAVRGSAQGIVFVVQPLIPYSEAQRLGDLAAATGWTVLGVLDEPSRRAKGERHEQ